MSENKVIKALEDALESIECVTRGDEIAYREAIDIAKAYEELEKAAREALGYIDIKATSLNGNVHFRLQNAIDNLDEAQGHCAEAREALAGKKSTSTDCDKLGEKT